MSCSEHRSVNARRPPLRRAALLLAWFVVVGACSAKDRTSEPKGTGATGGNAGTGGTGAVASGGVAGFTVGGSPGIGGRGSGGAATGGTGGTQTGGAAGTGTGGTLVTGGTGGSDGGSGSPGCPSKPGSPMIVVSAPSGAKYCMDSTEVTQAQYWTFFASAPASQPAYCSWNTSFAWEVGTTKCPNSAVDAAAKPNHPMVCIDWCDARAYCAWAGKRLCGRVGGGSNAYTDYANAAMSEWFNACSKGGGQAFPYGTTYSAGSCTSSQSRPVGSYSGCVGGFPGLFDMSGNVWEFEDSCNGSGGTGDCCRIRGGGFGVVNAGNSLRCDDVGGLCITRGTRDQTVGFRCCADYSL